MRNQKDPTYIYCVYIGRGTATTLIHGNIEISFLKSKRKNVN